MSRPNDIRTNLILPNFEELASYGNLRATNVKTGKRRRAL